MYPVLRHRQVSTLNKVYFVLAKAYFRMGIKNPNQEKIWKEKCVQILNYYPENRFHSVKSSSPIVEEIFQATSTDSKKSN
ncbi:hypothetical protein LEP1GSC062_0768 [Leptospira alexanderi serovar Manhao 3 str. L 60]|uniref:Uncharacterized protein n=1 Tax=Leptospira alexanderi serovar Manhao 3 str. L 60 TaxID=1049759 RepID=V6I927_9LEPT|nr:hypothetical protein LEP1GSC062_0768 [Leptospira alexanderi serovar Manhao 3 str. L 60]